MAKKNDFLGRLAKQSEIYARNKAQLAVTMAVDAAVLAANECFNAGPERAPEFAATMIEKYNQMAELIYDDSKDDKTLEYSKNEIDHALRQVIGDSLQPWEERHRIH